MIKTAAFLITLPIALLAFTSACESGDSGTSAPSDTPPPTPVPTPAFGLKSELVTPATDVAAMAFAPDGRLFYAEQYTGDIRIISADGTPVPEPFAHLDVAVWLTFAKTDWGLTGLALDPDFATNGYVYAFYSDLMESDPSRPIARPKLVRLTDQANRGVDVQTITQEFPETFLDMQGFRANGSIHFGPDGFLYLTMGDYDQHNRNGPNGVPYSQDLSSPLGKMLRVKKEDGSGADDNPFVNEPGSDPRVFALGFGEANDFTFHPETGGIFSSDGTESCEELNLIQPGGNYGFPPAGDFPYPDCTSDEHINGIHFLARPGMEAGQFQSGVGVGGLMFVSAANYPVLGDSLLLCERHTGFMRRLTLAGPNFDHVTAEDPVAFDCIRGVSVSPDGIIYYSNDKEVRRLVIGAR
jgi:glucose/arabinose dehydrogenase